MPVYEREGSPYWYYSFSVGGVRFRGSTGKTSKREARQVEAEKRHEAREGVEKQQQEWTLGMTLARYWNDHGKDQTSREYIWTKLNALYRVLGRDTPLSAISNSTLMDYRQTRRAEGLQPQTINRDLAHLKAAFNHANQMHGQQVPSIAWKRIRAAEPPARDRFLSREEYTTLLEFLDEPASLIVKFAVATGLRKANILDLDWNEVDLDSSVVQVTVKGNKRHTVRLTPPLRAALATLPHRKGRVFDTTNFRKKWERAVERAGLEDFRFHDLRHTCASWLRLAGVDIIDIKEILGHSSVAVTMRYAHIEPEHKTAALDSISADVWPQNEAQSTEKGRKRVQKS